MFISLFAFFFVFLLLLTIAIVNCADYFDYTANSIHTEELTAVECALLSDDEEEDDEDKDEDEEEAGEGEKDNKSNIVSFSRKTKKSVNSKSKKGSRKSFKNSQIAPLKMSSSVKNQVVVNDPMLFWKARTTKLNNGMILVDNVAYQNALKEGKAAGLVSPSDSSNHDATQLMLMMKKVSGFKGKSKGGVASSGLIAQRTMSFTPAPSKNISKVARSKGRSVVNERSAKTTRSKSAAHGSVLRKLQVSPSKILCSLNANKSTKRSILKGAKSKRKARKSESQSWIIKRSKE